MRRRGSNSSPLAAAALPLLLLLVAGCFHCMAAAARHLPSPGAPVQALDHQAETGGKAASAGADGAGGLVLQEGGTGNNGDELSSNTTLLETTTTMGAEACDDGNGKDECVLRRLLVDAHLDYIYTQHKGKP